MVVVVAVAVAAVALGAESLPGPRLAMGQGCKCIKASYGGINMHYNLKIKFDSFLSILRAWRILFHSDWNGVIYS